MCFLEKNDKNLETRNANATNYMAISYADLKKESQMTDVKDEKAELYSIPMLIRTFRRSSVASEN